MSFKSFILFFLLSSSLLAQSNIENSILLKINNKPVFTSEFLGEYEKNNNLRNVDFNVFYDNFVTYKTKIIQAKEMELDKLKTFENETNKYKEKLFKKHLKFAEKEEKIIEEAWERLKYDMNISFILIKPQKKFDINDTLKVVKELKVLKKQIQNREIDFDKITFKHNQLDVEVVLKNTWISALYLNYDVENIIYSLSEGAISEPFLSKDGFYMIRLDKKQPSIGKVQIAHISRKYSKKDRQSVEKVLDTVYRKLSEGKDFSVLARKYSQDKISAMNSGILPPFGIGELLPEIERIAYSIEENQFSKPIETSYGWHIIKLIKKMPIDFLKNHKSFIKSKIYQTKRFEAIENEIAKAKFNSYNILREVKDFEFVEALFLKKQSLSKAESSQHILSIDGKYFENEKYLNYLNSSPERYNSNLDFIFFRDEFLNKSIFEYYAENIENEDVEFRNIMRDFRNEILVYNLTEEKTIKLAKDTIELKKYFEKHKENYFWDERAETQLTICFDEESAKMVKKLLNKNKSEEEINEQLYSKGLLKAIFRNGKIEKTNDIFPEGFIWKKGVSDVYKKGNSFHIIKISNFAAPAPKKFNEAKREVEQNYKIELEKRWNEELAKYEVETNDSVLNRIKKAYNQ